MTEEDKLAMSTGLRLADSLLIAIRGILGDGPLNGYIAQVALLHAAVRVGVATRLPGHSADFFRKGLHEVLDEVLAYEEKKALKDAV